MSTPRVVLHADDVAMCNGANRAFVELSSIDTVSAGSVMVPCPWFTDLARAAAETPSLDIGVHLTLNSEQHGYRWGPVSGAGPSSGLLDDSGYLWARVADVRRHAHAEAVEAEWRAQIDRALAAGIDVTHLDAHMGSALAPEWCDRYVQVGVDYGLPVLITRRLSEYGPFRHLAGVTDDDFDGFVQQARTAGMPVVDRVVETDFARARGAAVDYRSLVSDAASDVGHDGLVYCAFHPCRPGPGEIEVIDPRAHHVRVDEYELFRTDDWRQWLANAPFEVIDMRTLRDEFRAGQHH